MTNIASQKVSNQEIVAKLWNLCNVLRDDGITYHQYVTELTFILFLKMANEAGAEEGIPEGYRWENLLRNDDGSERNGVSLHDFYKKLLVRLGEKGSNIVQGIYAEARTNIRDPRNLKAIVQGINALDWHDARREGLGDLYEGLLQKNATESKNGAGQYFTVRPLIDSMVRLTEPKIGELCNDPACGTFGFMVAANQYLLNKTNNYADLTEKQRDFQKKKAFSGVELVPETHRLALMNAVLHGMECEELLQGDTLGELGMRLKNFDLVLANPPFGTKKGGEKTSRKDITYRTSNKQLNFLQHIYGSLKTNGKARAAVVLPDNVLTADGDGQRVRQGLLENCNLHTVLRLPTGIFYAQGVKTNVLFFTRSKTPAPGNTPEVWFYDLRTNMDSFGKRATLTAEHFADFEKAFTARKRAAVRDERWTRVPLADIEAKNYSLDFGLIRDESLVSHDDLPEPDEIAQNALVALERAADSMRLILQELEREMGTAKKGGGHEGK